MEIPVKCESCKEQLILDKDNHCDCCGKDYNPPKIEKESSKLVKRFK